MQGAIASVMGIAGVLAPVLFTQVSAAAIGRGQIQRARELVDSVRRRAHDRPRL